MYDARSLKPRIEVLPDTVECPVLGCGHRVARARKRLQRLPAYQCPVHRLFMTPSTFEYEDYRDNLLLRDEEDRELLRGIVELKRETKRLGRERSEDALTFNVFRTLERESLLDGVLSEISGQRETAATPAYWCCAREQRGVHRLLATASSTFGEAEGRGSEPDLIIDSEDAIFLIEAKLGSRNETVPSRPSALKTYRDAHNGWYGRVIRSEPEQLAVELKLYQLMRLWLLGTWMAGQASKRLVLVSLVPESSDKELVKRFEPHLVMTQNQVFRRFTWEQIRDLTLPHRDCVEVSELVEYLDNRTLGYDRSGRRRLAFAARAQ